MCALGEVSDIRLFAEGGAMLRSPAKQKRAHELATFTLLVQKYVDGVSICSEERF